MSHYEYSGLGLAMMQASGMQTSAFSTAPALTGEQLMAQWQAMNQSWLRYAQGDAAAYAEVMRVGGSVAGYKTKMDALLAKAKAKIALEKPSMTLPRPGERSTVPAGPSSLFSAQGHQFAKMAAVPAAAQTITPDLAPPVKQSMASLKELMQAKQLAEQAAELQRLKSISAKAAADAAAKAKLAPPVPTGPGLVPPPPVPTGPGFVPPPPVPTGPGFVLPPAFTPPPPAPAKANTAMMLGGAALLALMLLR